MLTNHAYFKQGHKLTWWKGPNFIYFIFFKLSFIREIFIEIPSGKSHVTTGQKTFKVRIIITARAHLYAVIAGERQ